MCGDWLQTEVPPVHPTAQREQSLHIGTRANKGALMCPGGTNDQAAWNRMQKDRGKLAVAII